MSILIANKHLIKELTYNGASTWCGLEVGTTPIMQMPSVGPPPDGICRKCYAAYCDAWDGFTNRKDSP